MYMVQYSISGEVFGCISYGYENYIVFPGTDGNKVILD